MRLHKQFWIILLSFTPTFVAVTLLIQYSWPGDEGFHLVEELKSGLFVGVFTAILMYFNRYTIKGQPRGEKGKRTDVPNEK